MSGSPAFIFLSFKKKELAHLRQPYGAGDENRTHNLSLGSSYFTTKLRPRKDDFRVRYPDRKLSAQLFMVAELRLSENNSI